MAFYSGYKCDKCGEKWQLSGMTASEAYSITHLRRFAKGMGWSVGKKVLLCNKCRNQKKPTSAATEVSE